MASMVSIKWSDDWLRAALKSAFRSAAYQSRNVSRGLVKGSSGVASRVTVRFHGDSQASVFSTDPKAHWWELGIGAHEIVAGESSSRRRRSVGFGSGGTLGKVTVTRTKSTGKRALKFDGRFAASVSHPGMSARPFLRPMLPAFPAIYRSHAARRL